MTEGNSLVLPAGPLRRLTTLTAVFIVVLELLDITIVNVALPDIQGSLGAKVSVIAWVITAYILASTLMTPLTGFIAGRLGRRRLMLIDIPLFILFSFLCGTSTNIYELIFFRALQGMAAGTMIPLAQALLIDIYPKAETNKAMALFGVGIMLGPILGPFLGGVIDQNLNWNWIFFINVLLGLLAFAMAFIFVKETPTKKSPTDFLGLILMIIAIVCIQLFLSQGNSDSWFQSHTIQCLFSLGFVSSILFIWRTLAVKNPIVNLRLFANRNLLSSSLMIFLYGTPLFGSMVLIPLFLSNLMGYEPTQIGILLLIRGLSSLVVIPFVANIFMRFVDFRITLSIGAIIGGIGNWMLSTVNASISPENLYLPLILQGISTAFIMPTLMTIAFSTLKESDTDDASGLLNFCRGLGSSLGITVTILVLNTTMQLAWSSIGSHISKFNHALNPWLAKQGLTLQSPTAAPILGNLLSQQSALVSYMDSFRFVSIVAFCLIFLTFFLQKKHKA